MDHLDILGHIPWKNLETEFPSHVKAIPSFPLRQREGNQIQHSGFARGSTRSWDLRGWESRARSSLSLSLVFSAIWEIPRKCNEEQFLRIRGLKALEFTPEIWDETEPFHASGKITASAGILSAYGQKSHFRGNSNLQSQSHRAIQDGKDLLDPQIHAHLPLNRVHGFSGHSQERGFHSVG